MPPAPGAEDLASAVAAGGRWGAAAALAVPDPSGPPSPHYVATVEITYPAELNRWLPLVKWLLAVPHYIALWFVAIGAFFVAIYAFFAVLFTGRWPRGPLTTWSERSGGSSGSSPTCT